VALEYKDEQTFERREKREEGKDWIDHVFLRGLLISLPVRPESKLWRFLFCSISCVVSSCPALAPKGVLNELGSGVGSDREGPVVLLGELRRLCNL
jgi:hypothetical protein